MGRELIVQAIKKDNTEPLYQDYICGRNETTDYIADMIYNKVKEDKTDLYEISFKISDNKLTDIKTYLTELRGNDEKTHQRELDLIEDIRLARQKANYEDFINFTEYLDDLYQDLDSYCSKATILLEIIDKVNQNITTDYIVTKSSIFDYSIKFILAE